MNLNEGLMFTCVKWAFVGCCLLALLTVLDGIVAWWRGKDE